MTAPTPRKRAPGAGRKPLGPSRRITRSVCLSSDAWANLDALAAKSGASRSETLNQIAEKLKP